MEIFWEKTGWELTDKHLKGLSKAPFQRDFPAAPSKPGLYFARGPRQIGKSTWLKTLLKSACGERGVGPKNCYYLSCENIKDYKELAEILASVRHRKVVLLDEISFVSEWWRAVKHEADRGQIPFLILTGSHAADIRQGMDRMPGRWAENGEIQMLPMDFHEFLKMRMQAGWCTAKEFTVNERRLEELTRYFTVGGFPAAVAEGGSKGVLPKESLKTYLLWLKGDLTRLGKQETYLRETLLQLALTTGSTISLQKLAQRTQMGSHHTAQEYVAALQDSFALRTLYALDLESGAPRFRKDKKFYFSDPLIFHAALAWSNEPLPHRWAEQVAEQVAHESLHRRFGPSPPLGYLHTPKGEIDFIHRSRWALEVKWAPEARNISRVFIDLNWANKTVWTQNNFLEEWP